MPRLLSFENLAEIPRDLSSGLLISVESCLLMSVFEIVAPPACPQERLFRGPLIPPTPAPLRVPWALFLCVFGGLKSLDNPSQSQLTFSGFFEAMLAFKIEPQSSPNRCREVVQSLLEFKLLLNF